MITPLSTNPSLNAEVGFNLARWKVASQAEIFTPNCPHRAILRTLNSMKNHKAAAKLNVMLSCRISSPDRICFLYSSVCCFKKKKQPFLFCFFSSSPPLGPQLVSVCKSWGLGCQMSGLVLSCQREEWAEMIDDWEA